MPRLKRTRIQDDRFPKFHLWMESIIRMQSQGMTADAIADELGLPRDEIRELLAGMRGARARTRGKEGNPRRGKFHFD